MDGIKICIAVVFEVVDLLYMTRSYIHQECLLDDIYSLYLILWCYQQYTWGDLFKILLPKAVGYGYFETYFLTKVSVLFIISYEN